MKIQLKRSNQLTDGSAKEPSVDHMEWGELAVNYNGEDPAVFTKVDNGDGTGTIIRIGGSGAAGSNEVIVSPTAPDPINNDLPEGALWWNSAEDAGQLFVLYQDPAGGGGGDSGGLKWIEASPQPGPPENPGYPEDLEDGDGATLDARYVKTVGDTMTGSLSVADKITLDAENGSAEFAGDVTVNNNTFLVSSSRTNSAFGHLNITSSIFGDPDINSSSVFSVTSSGSVKATGSLLLGGEQSIDNSNIMLNGGDGSAEFAGGKISLESNSSAVFDRKGEDDYGRVEINSSEKAFIVKDKNGTAKLTLEYDGSAGFAGDVSSGKIYSGNIQASTAIENTYQYRAVYNSNCNFTVSNRGAYFGGTQAFNGDGSLAQISFDDGSAEFASGSIELNADGTGKFTGNTLDVGASGQFSKVRIARPTDGAIGNCFFGFDDRFDQVNDADEGGIASTSGSGIINLGCGATSGYVSIQGLDTESDTFSEVAKLTGKGGAEFSGDVNVSDIDVGSGVRVTAAGLIQSRHDGNGANDSFFVGYKGGLDVANITTRLYNNGNAFFAGMVECGNDANPVEGSNGFVSMVTTVTGSPYLAKNKSSGGYNFKGYNAGEPAAVTSAIYEDGSAKFAGTVEQNASITRSLVIQTEPDNDANYTTTTDAEGNTTRVYNGPTLDVKERLTKADTALQNLKTAAAAASDFASLKAAIATALADI